MNPQQPLTAKGRNGTISFDGHTVAIIRKGFIARATVGKGEKRIPVSSITAIQLKPAGAITEGFIQFTLAGGVERRSRFGQQTNDARSDENSVTFWKSDQPAFEAIRSAIEETQRWAQQPGPGRAPDVAAQLASLAQLHAQGALSDQEFAAAKDRLLRG